MDDSWKDQAECADTDSDIFVRGGAHEEKDSIAKIICSMCQVRIECLEYAIEYKMDYGIWGGTTGNERKRLRTRTLQKMRESIRRHERGGN